MSRRRKQEEHENHERWLISYADFITLLFAFFVVMYSISSVNEGKYRVLSSSLVTAFTKPGKTLDPIQHGKKIQAPIIQHKSITKSENARKRTGVDHEIMPTASEIAEMQKLADEVEDKLKDLVDKEVVSVHKTNKGVEIEIKSSILFDSGKAVIQKSARKTLEEVANILKQISSPVNVEGFTDNVPIKTLYFPSNWELSAARAANVVHLFEKFGIDPHRLSAIGYGEYQPIASNTTLAGRGKNRRINVVVLNREEAKRKRIAALNKPKEEKVPDTIPPGIKTLGGAITLGQPAVNDKQSNSDSAPLFNSPTTPNQATPDNAPVSLPPPRLLPFGKKASN